MIVILIDEREGSKNLPQLFPGELVFCTMLPAGDIIISNPAMTEHFTVIEFKKVKDLLQCICNGRFAGTQLPDMMALSAPPWGINSIWLLVEGNIDGTTHVGNREFKKSDIESWIRTMVEFTPLKIKITKDRSETRDWIMESYQWWNKPKLHRSHLVTDNSRREIEIVRASLLRSVAEKFPGIGHMKAFNVERRFVNELGRPSLFEAVIAEPDAWMQVEGVGDTMATRIYNAIRGW